MGNVSAVTRRSVLANSTSLPFPGHGDASQKSVAPSELLLRRLESQLRNSSSVGSPIVVTVSPSLHGRHRLLPEKNFSSRDP